MLNDAEQVNKELKRMEEYLIIFDAVTNFNISSIPPYISITCLN